GKCWSRPLFSVQRWRVPVLVRHPGGGAPPAGAALYDDRVARRVRNVAAVSDYRVAAIDDERVARRATDAAAGHGDGACRIREADGGSAGIRLHHAVEREGDGAVPDDLVVAPVDVDVLHRVTIPECEHVGGGVRRQGCRTVRVGKRAAGSNEGVTDDVGGLAAGNQD